MSEQRKWTAAVCATALVMGLVAGACGSSSEQSGSPSGSDGGARQNVGVVESTEKPVLGGKIVYGLLAETNGWNPSTNNWGASGLQVTKALFDTMAAYDENSNIKPNLAESFTPNADYTEWTVKLRPNVKLHNGKVVTAETVVRNQTYLHKSPITGPAYRFAGVETFTKQDDLSFVVKLNKPVTVLPALFATQLGVVVDADWLESNDGLKPIGTGPFRLDEWVIDQKLSTVKNQDYWQTDKDGTRLPYLDAIEFRVIIDTSSRSAAMRANDLEVMESSSGAQVKDFQQLEEYQVYADSKGETIERMIMLNTQKEPLNDPEVRKALAYATDKVTYADQVSQGFDEVASGPTAPNSPWYTKTNYPSYDPAKAKELIDKAKERHGGSIKIELTGSIAPETQIATQLLQQQWAAVGVEVTVNLVEQAKLIIQVVSGSYQATAWLQFDAPVPYVDGVWLDPKGAVAPPAFALNFSRNKDEAIGAALDASAADPTIEGQRKQWAIIQERLAEDIPYIWLTHTRISIIASKRIVNLTNYELPGGGGKGLDLQQGAHSVKQIWLKP